MLSDLKIISGNKVRDMANYINKFEGSHGAVRDIKRFKRTFT